MLAIEAGEKQEVAAAAGARHLAADRALLARQLIELVDMPVRDVLVETLLVLPGLVEQLSDRVHVAEQERLLHLEDLLLEMVERGDRRRPALAVRADLALDDVRRLARLPHVAEQQPVLELVEHLGADAQRIHQRRVGVELDQVEAAEGGGVLILAAAGESQVFALDPISELGGVVAGERPMEPGPEHSEQRHYQGGRGAQPRPGRSVGVNPEVGAAADLQGPHRRLDEIEVAVEAHATGMVVLRHHVVIQARERPARVAARPERGEGVLIDGGREHHAAVLFGVGRHVGTAAAERKTQRGAGAEVGRRSHEAK